MPTTTVQKEIDELKNRLSHLERVLILGDGDRLPLAEVVRNLTNTVNDYIERKNKEDERRKLEEEEAQKEKRDQWNKIKLMILGTVLSFAIPFIWQAFVIYYRLLPLIEKLSP